MADRWRTRRYDLRPARPGDAAFVHTVRVAGLRPYVEPIWGWDDELQDARFRGSFDPARYRVVVVDGQDVGILAVERRPGEVFVADIGIVAAWRNRGLGSTILLDVATRASEDGMPVALQVLRTNPARRLYERLGFRAIDESDTHVVMRRDPSRP